ncbi:MAG TPA: segregation/condensation protein A [Saprospiraceae bacterium]|nr:segregation/condensation protein A [Saprospiraceae bacterium]HPN69790.1 segregation/condensation protein A [Saprospiraceae bacterium]
MQSYNIKISKFEGPFDLLLFFIERDELDIYDIPIATITEDFLEYIKHLETLNIDVASEFILVAATLMKIKARMLIPRKEIDADGNEIDPRAELTQKLLEYKRYKSIIEDLEQMEYERSLKHGRGNLGAELAALSNKALADSEIESISLYKLFQTFARLLERYESQSNKVVHRIIQYEYTVEGQSKILKEKIAGKRANFEELFNGLSNRMEAIVTFLALLEMLNLQLLNIIQGTGSNNFWLEEKTGDEEE